MQDEVSSLSSMLRASSYPVSPSTRFPAPLPSTPTPIPAMPPSILSTNTPSSTSPQITPLTSVASIPITSTSSHDSYSSSSLLTTLVQFVEFGSTVVRQLRRMESEHEDMPSVFQGVRTRLPLMLDLVRKIMLQMDAGLVNESTQEIMGPVAHSCVKYAHLLSELVNKTAAQVTPSKVNNREGAWPRGRRSTIGALVEPELARIDAVLKANFDVLARAGTFQATRSNATSTFSMGSHMVGSQDFYSPTPLRAGHRSATFHGDLDRRTALHQATPGGIGVPPMPSLPPLPPIPVSSFPPIATPSATHRTSISGVSPWMERRSTTPSNVVFMVPFPRDFNFVGRNEILRCIDEKFMEQSCVALTGLGGIGKTQIVIEYAYIFKERNPRAHVFWVYGNSGTRFEESYEEIARRLQLPGWDEPTVDNLQIVYGWFNNDCDMDYDEDDDSARWLFILDNADDASVFYPSKSSAPDYSVNRNHKSYARYLPINSTGAVLLTTRDRRVGERLSGRTRPVEIGSMSREEANELLMSKIAEENWDPDDGTTLCEELFFLPLALTQAAAFISENNITVSEYLDMLFAGDDDMKELLSEHLEDSRRELDTENSVMRTWKLSFDQISRGMPRAAEILSLLAVMDYHHVNQSLLRKEKETEIGFKTGLGALQAFHLITVGRGKDGVCKMHRLVALSTQKWLEVRGLIEYWQAQALEVVEHRFPGPGKQNFSDWATYESLTPHARMMFSYQFTQKEDLLKKAKLLVAVTLYHLSKGRYTEAFDMSSKALEIRQNLLSHDDPLTLDSVQTIGECLLHRCELKLARTMLERAVTGREKSLGPDDADTLDSLSDLTITLLELGDNDTAEITGMKALKGREKVFGDGHAETLVSRNIIAILLHRQGKLQEAKELGETVLRAREALLGEEHPDTIMTRNNVARLHLDLGDLAKAGALIDRVIKGEEQVLGAEGYDIQITLSNAALVKCEEGDFAAAEKLVKRVLEVRERLLGKEHPSAVWSVEMLGEVARRAGKIEEAEKWERLASERTKPRVEEVGMLDRAGLLFD